MDEGEKLIPINIEDEMKSATLPIQCQSLCHVPYQTFEMA